MKNKRQLLRNSLIIIHIFFAILGLCIYISNYNLSEKLLVQRELSKEQIIAKAGSLSVEDLLITVQNELNSFVFSFTKTNDFSLIDLDNTRSGFLSYIGRAQRPINGIAYYNPSGTLSVIEDKQNLHLGENQNFSKTPLILWSKNPANREKIFISTPYISTVGGSVGKTILVVAKPIYFGNTYKGTLAIRILLEDLRNTFINPLIADSTEDAFIVDSHAVLIADKNNFLNKNLFAYAQKNKWSHYKDFEKKLQKIIAGNDTQTTWFFQNPKEKPTEFLIGASRIGVPNTDKDLYLIVTTPKEEVLSLLTALRLYGYFWLVFSVIMTLLGSIIVCLIKE
jgi:hypothetical protein